MLEKIFSISTKKIYEVDFKNNGGNKVPCPECSSSRKNKKDLCLSYNIEQKVGFCHHCEARFVKYEKFEQKVNYKVPEWKNFTALSDQALKWFEKRFIGSRVLQKMNVSSKIEFMPQIQKQTTVIAFPFYKNDKIINVKYRDGAKNFKLESGAEVTWYNHKAIAENKELILTEGEIDCLSFMQEGFDNVISVPNGANINLPFLDIEDFVHLEKIYIAVDNDSKGLQLRDELCRRLGEERCFVCYFNEFKDANEYLVGNGHNSLNLVLKNAKQINIEGVVEVQDFEVEIEDLYENGLQRGKQIGVDALDDLITWETKRFAVWTGVPSSGKSELLDFVNIKLNLLHGWKVAYWSPENFPLSYHYSKIAEKLTGVKFDKKHLSNEDYLSSKEYIKDNFFWVNPKDDFTLDNILAKAKYLVKTKGIKIFVLDPFNKIENEVDYKMQGKLLDKMINFAKQYDVLFHLVAHPKKLQPDKGIFQMPTLYDISGSGDFYNKTDYGICVARKQNPEDKTFENFGEAMIQKVKFKHIGKQGVWSWKYNYNNGRYELPLSDINKWDNTNWLNPKNAESTTPKTEFSYGMQNNYEEPPF